jgi:ribosome maturation factor RimP
MRKIDPVLNERLVKLTASMGYELVGCELLSLGGGQIFRIYIDGEKGVTVDDCSKVSRQISAMMDVEEPFQSRYTLEVSSPGIDRPLFLIEHYQKYIGCQVKIRLHAAINQRRQYKGRLQRVEEENIHILVDGLENEVVLPFSAIEKGNLIKETCI